MPISNPSLPSVPDDLHVDGLTLDTSRLLITARTTAAQACCQVCGRASVWVHSRYWRTFEDLPWQDRSMAWRVHRERARRLDVATGQLACVASLMATNHLYNPA